MGVECSTHGRKKSRQIWSREILTRDSLEQKALMEWCGMDSAGFAYEPVAESFEIGNDPSGIKLDGEFPEQQLSEY